MKYLLFSLTVFFGLSSQGRSDDWNAFQYIQPIEGELRGNSLGVVSLTPEVFGETALELRDLRLRHVDDSGSMELPYLVVPREVGRAIQSTKIPSKVIALDQLEGGSLVITVELEGERGAARLQTNNRLRDFEKNVRVEGSLDLESWSVVVGEALIFDYSRFLDFRRSSIELPENDYQYFRVTIEDATDQQLSKISTLRRQVSDSSGVTVDRTNTVTKRDFRIDQLSFYTQPVERENVDRAIRSYPIGLVEEVENAELKRSEIVIEASRAPLTALVMKTEQTNFRRTVELQVPSGDGLESWRTIRRTEVYRYEIGDLKEEKLRIPVSEAAEGLRTKRLRLLIHQGDNAPVRVNDLEGEGRIHDLHFVSPAAGQLELVFGAGEGWVNKPGYDVAAIRMGMRRKMAYSTFAAG
ncbi:MAG: DUF3999 family protein, partial [Verrucomicrobiota bacterium]